MKIYIKGNENVGKEKIVEALIVINHIGDFGSNLIYYNPNITDAKLDHPLK